MLDSPPLITSSTDPASREHRCEVLAAADPDKLVQLAERALATDSVAESLTILHRPETGMVVLQVREPVCRERFHLGEVVVTRAEVALDGHRGWAMRLGTDRPAALAAALCDALAEASRPDWSDLADEVARLCALTEDDLRTADEAEWSALSRTAVAFEALD